MVGAEKFSAPTHYQLRISPMKKAIIVIFSVLFIDQFIKIWIKTHMTLGQEINVMGDWFIIHFTENPGMAFGLVLEGEYGKLILTVFRIIAVFLIGWYLWDIIKKKATTIMIISIALVMAGAIGNIIDSVIYGVLFNESGYREVADFMPAEGGYAPLLHGKVVDMLYFPIVDTHLPDWLPTKPVPKPGWMPGFLYSIFPWANDHLLFFRPVFNIADASITIGVILILLFQRQFFGHSRKSNKKIETVPTAGSGPANLFTEPVITDSVKDSETEDEP